ARRPLMLQSDAAALGTATTTSTTFVDVGNGSTTGFAGWTASIGAVGTFLLSVDLSFYITGVVGIVYFQVLVDGSTTGVSNPVNSSQAGMNSLSNHRFKSWRIPITFSTTGNHTIKLQWKVSGAGTTATVDTSNYRLYTLQVSS